MIIQFLFNIQQKKIFLMKKSFFFSPKQKTFLRRIWKIT